MAKHFDNISVTGKITLDSTPSTYGGTNANIVIRNESTGDFEIATLGELGATQNYQDVVNRSGLETGPLGATGTAFVELDSLYTGGGEHAYKIYIWGGATSGGFGPTENSGRMEVGWQPGGSAGSDFFTLSGISQAGGSTGSYNFAYNRTTIVNETSGQIATWYNSTSNNRWDIVDSGGAYRRIDLDGSGIDIDNYTSANNYRRVTMDGGNLNIENYTSTTSYRTITSDGGNLDLKNYAAVQTYSELLLDSAAFTMTSYGDTSNAAQIVSSGPTLEMKALYDGAGGAATQVSRIVLEPGAVQLYKYHTNPSFNTIQAGVLEISDTSYTLSRSNTSSQLLNQINAIDSSTTITVNRADQFQGINVSIDAGPTASPVVNIVGATYSADLNVDGRVFAQSTALGATSDTRVVVVDSGTGEFKYRTDISGGLSDGDYGDVTVSGSGSVITIDNNVVSNAKLRDSAALSVIGRSTNSSGDPADIAASSDGQVLRRAGTTLGFGQITADGITNLAVNSDKIANDAVINTKLANMAQSTIKGRASGAGTGDPTDLTAAQVRTIINVEDGAQVNPTLSRTLTLQEPTASDDVTIFRTDVAITVQEVIAVSTGTSPSTTYQLKHSTDRSAAGNNLTTSAATTSTTTGDTATLSDATIPANSWVWIETTAASGTSVYLSVDIRYTED